MSDPRHLTNTGIPFGEVFRHNCGHLLPRLCDPLLYNTVVCTEYNHCTAAEIHLYRTGHPCNPCNRLFQQAQSAQRFGNTIPPLPGTFLRCPVCGMDLANGFFQGHPFYTPSNCAHFSRKCCAQRGFDAKWKWGNPANRDSDTWIQGQVFPVEAFSAKQPSPLSVLVQ